MWTIFPSHVRHGTGNSDTRIQLDARPFTAGSSRAGEQHIGWRSAEDGRLQFTGLVMAHEYNVHERNNQQALTFFDTILFGSVRIAILLLARDTLNAFVEMVLVRSAMLGVCAVCIDVQISSKSHLPQSTLIYKSVVARSSILPRKSNPS